MLRNNILKVSKPALTLTQPAKRTFIRRFPNMPVFYTNPLANDLNAIFRLVDTALTGPQTCGPQRTYRHTFQPTFDVRETEAGFELRGELPGVEQKDLTVEFSDPTTLVIRGQQEKSWTNKPKAAEKAAEEATEASETGSYHKPTVEEDAEDGFTNVTEKTETEKAVEKPIEKAPEEPAYILHERSSGSFLRKFKFPSTIDAEQVNASLRNGVLSITIPKRADLGPRRVEIQ
jgi:HSP20 family protein